MDRVSAIVNTVSRIADTMAPWNPDRPIRCPRQQRAERIQGMAQPDKQLQQPGRRRRPRKGDEKEAAIVQTAWRLLSQQSLSSITIDQLASGAGISRPTFYFYFDSREAVIRALAAQVAEELRQQAKPAPPPGGTAEEVIRQGVQSYLDRWRRQGPILRAMVPLYEADPKLREFWDTISEEFI